MLIIKYEETNNRSVGGQPIFAISETFQMYIICQIKMLKELYMIRGVFGPQNWQSCLICFKIKFIVQEC